MSVIKVELNILLPNEGDVKLPIVNEYTLVLSSENIEDEIHAANETSMPVFTDVITEKLSNKSVNTTVFLDPMREICAGDYETISSRHFYTITNQFKEPAIYTHNYTVEALGLQGQII